MTIHRALVLGMLLIAPPAAGGAADPPVAVSPGHPSRMVSIDAACPTFSWGRAPGADSYELIVYRVRRDAEEARVVLRASIDGRAGSWTPTLDRCLERGGRYAWSLRARRPDSASAWSAPALFRVAPGPTAAELAEAPSALPGESSANGRRGARVTAADAPNGPTGELPDARERAAEPPAPGEPSATSLSVEGGIEAASFHGDGSGLANVEAAGLSCAQCVAGAELQDASVTAAKIGEACAPGQVLMRGVAGWECATLTAPACAPGDEIACYTGPAATRGIGECRSGTRTCDAGSAWGACSGEIIPAAAETCDGLDNTCDGATDEGDPALLCPPTANVVSTLCDAAACAVESCAELWADADGDYANGCEAPAPGACLDGGSPRPTVAPGAGDLLIQELLADPASPLTDSAAEWFEVAARASVDLNGLGIGTAFGTVVDQLDADDCLSVQDGDLLLFVRSADTASNGDLAADQTFSFSLVNSGGDLHLAHGGDLVDAISWSAEDVAPGRARNLPPGFQDPIGNDDQANWCNVPADPALLYSAGNYGTPGVANVACQSAASGR